MTDEELKEIRELAKQVDSENWEHTVLGDSEHYITIGYKYENGKHQANWIAEIDSDEKESEEIESVGEFITWCAQNVPKLLDEVERLDDIVRDQTNDIIHYESESKKQKQEIERLRRALKAIGDELDEDSYESRVGRFARRALEGASS